jgi:hypothetical protein
MSPAPYRLLRFVFIGIGIIHIVTASLLQLVFSDQFISEKINPITTPYSWWSGYVMTVVLIGIGVTLALRLNWPSYHIFLAGFLIFFGLDHTLSRVFTWIPKAGLSIEVAIAAVTGTLFIYSFMRFAGKHPPAEYGQYFACRKRPGWYKRAVIFFSKDKPFWGLMFPLIVGVMVVSTVAPPPVSGLINIMILFTGLVYFRISFYFAGSENRNRLAWVLWGLITTIGMYIVQLFLWLLYPELLLLRITADIFNKLVICFSFIMCVFFSRGTDARFVVRKTLIYGAIFLAGLFVFGAIEHYVIHMISHALHIQSSILNSCLGAAIALMIRPLHHKVEVWLGKLEKTKELHAPGESRQTTKVSA